MKLFASARRYLRLFGAFFRFSFHAETAFRGNLLFWTVENLAWLLLAFVGINLVYGQVDSFAGWDKNEALLVVFIASLFHDLCWTLIFRNLGDFSRLVREGEFDFILLKPISKRFLLSFKVVEFDHYVRIFLEVFLMVRYTVLITGGISWLNVLLSLITFISGFIIFYSLYFAAVTTNIWFVNLANLIDFFHDLKDLGSKTTYIFKRGWFFFFSFILPVAYIATFPAEALLGRISVERVVVAPFLAGIFLWGSQRFFRFALKYYSSASS